MTIPRSVESVTDESVPWVHHMTESQAEMIRATLSGADVLIIELDGSKMRTVDGLFSEYQRGFLFPEYFGWNWNAFDECIRDLEWLPARKYVTIIGRADQLLSKEWAEITTYLRIIQSAAQTWSSRVGLGYERGHSDIPFNTVLIESGAAHRPRGTLANIRSTVAGRPPLIGDTTSPIARSTARQVQSHPRTATYLLGAADEIVWAEGTDEWRALMTVFLRYLNELPAPRALRSVLTTANNYWTSVTQEAEILEAAKAECWTFLETFKGQDVSNPEGRYGRALLCVLDPEDSYGEMRDTAEWFAAMVWNIR
ncbi:Barstar (barnase inhibitor) [Arthrobacter sp. 31Cvi3.1E]|nr:hypothetical protein [Paenarthrobacter nicotinovorans]SKC02762.1 Barstar (barnase inhibitor) [Arthrobacter sp. 31Cvi3.1E]